MLNPFSIFYLRSRRKFGKILVQVLISPFGRVKFRESFLGDVLTSMVKTMFDFEYVLCYYFSMDWQRDTSYRCTELNLNSLAIISGIPLLWRLLQCLRLYYNTKVRSHLFNSCKYGLAFITVFFSSLTGAFSGYETTWFWHWPIQPLIFLLLFISSTLFTFSWDVLMDWDRLQVFDKRKFLLRENLMYYKWFYYYCIVSNFFFRFFWAVSITPVPINIGIKPQLLNIIAAGVEVVRRFTWSLLRVEKEHLLNCEAFRAIEFISLPVDLNEFSGLQRVASEFSEDDSSFQFGRNSLSSQSYARTSYDLLGDKFAL